MRFFNRYLLWYFLNLLACASICFTYIAPVFNKNYFEEIIDVEPSVIDAVGETDIFGETSITGYNANAFPSGTYKGIIGSPSSDGYADNISVYLGGASPSVTLKCGLYNSDLSFYASTEEVEWSSPGNGWCVCDFTSQVFLDSDDDYYISFFFGDTIAAFYKSGGNGRITGTNTYPTWEDPADSSDTSFTYVIYCSYTIASGNNPPVQSDESPANGSSNIGLIPELYVNCTDVDGDMMNITWWTNATGGKEYNISHNPVLISYTVEDASTRMPTQRNLWYGADNWWAFFINDTTGTNDQRAYSSSPDGINWREPVNIRDSRGGAEFSVWVVGNKIHYCYVYQVVSGGETPKYRMGTLNTNGTITWDASEQEICGYTYASDGIITIDSDGCPWVSFINTSSWRPVIAKSDWNNGSWHMASGFPYELNNSLDDYLPIPVPLTNGKVYVVYAYSNEVATSGPIYGRLWNGTEWGGQELITSYTTSDQFYGKHNVVSIGDDVHLIFANDTTEFLYTYRNISGIWSEPVEFNNAVSERATPILCKTQDNNLIAFWFDQATGFRHHGFFKRYNASNNTWYGLVDWFEDMSVYINDDFLYNTHVCSYEEVNGSIGFIYRNGTTPYTGPFGVKFNRIDMGREWVKFGENRSVYSGIFSQSGVYFSDPDTTYYWKVNISDGNGGYSEETYHFSTIAGFIVNSSGFHTGGNATLNYIVNSSGYHVGGNSTVVFSVNNSGYHMGGNSSIFIINNNGYHIGGNISNFAIDNQGFHTGGNETISFIVDSSGYHMGGNESAPRNWNLSSSGFHSGGNNSKNLGFNISSSGYHLGGNNSDSFIWTIDNQGFHTGGNLSTFSINSSGFHTGGNNSDFEILFVSTTGNDVTGDGTIGNPFASLNKAQDMASDGDTIYIRGGTYTNVPLSGTSGFSITHHGTIDNPYTISAYNNEEVIIDVGGKELNGWVGIFNFGTGDNNITIDGIEFYNITDDDNDYPGKSGSCPRGFYIDGTDLDNIKILNCTFRHMIYYAICVWEDNVASNGYIENIEVANCRFIDCQWNTSLGETIGFVGCKNIEFHDNIIRNTEKIGVAFSGGCLDVSCHDNDFQQNGSKQGDSIYCDPQNYNGGSIYNVEIFNNIIWGEPETITTGGGQCAIGLCGEDEGGILDNISIYNNIINVSFNSIDGDKFIHGIDIRQEYSNPAMYNNITVKYNTVFINQSIGKPIVVSVEPEYIINMVIANNIFVTKEDRTTIHQGLFTNLIPSDITMVNNTYNHTSGVALGGNWKGSLNDGYMGIDSINASPEFKDCIGGDFTLNSTSPCIDNANDTWIVDTDVIGTVRPQGSSYDIGAFESLITTQWNLNSSGFHSGGNVSAFNIDNYGFHTGGNATLNYIVNSSGYHVGGNSTVVFNVDNSGFHSGGNNSKNLGFNISSSGYHLGGNNSDSFIWTIDNQGFHTGGNLSTFSINSSGFHTGGNETYVPHFKNNSSGYHLGGNAAITSISCDFTYTIKSNMLTLHPIIVGETHYKWEISNQSQVTGETGWISTNDKQDFIFIPFIRETLWIRLWSRNTVFDLSCTVVKKIEMFKSTPEDQKRYDEKTKGQTGETSSSSDGKTNNFWEKLGIDVKNPLVWVVICIIAIVVLLFIFKKYPRERYFYPVVKKKEKK